MRKGLLILGAALMTLAPFTASAAIRGYVVVGRPYYGGFYGGFYSPFWGPYWAPYGGYYLHPELTPVAPAAK